MKCNECGNDISKVIDSRPCQGSIRRRRKCEECGARWTTYERVCWSETGKHIRPLHEVLKVEFEVIKQGFRADAKVLPGMPPVGFGKTKEEALYDMLSKIIWDWDTWGKFVTKKTKEVLSEGCAPDEDTENF